MRFSRAKTSVTTTDTYVGTLRWLSCVSLHRRIPLIYSNSDGNSFFFVKRVIFRLNCKWSTKKERARYYAPSRTRSVKIERKINPCTRSFLFFPLWTMPTWKLLDITSATRKNSIVYHISIHSDNEEIRHAEYFITKVQKSAVTLYCLKCKTRLSLKIYTRAFNSISTVNKILLWLTIPCHFYTTKCRILCWVRISKNYTHNFILKF